MKASISFLVLGLLILGASNAPSPALAVPSPTVLITAVYSDPFVAGEGSEAIQLQNVGAAPVSLANWRFTDGEGAVVFPAAAMLNPGQKIWISKSAVAFRAEFGFLPAFEYGGNSDPTVPDMTGSAPSLANTGDQVILQDDTNAGIDAMVYGNATLSAPDWSGDAVQPSKIGAAAVEGQILYRKLWEADGMPVPDTDTLGDWAQDPADPFLGKKMQYPGWDLDEFFQTLKTNDSAMIKYCVAPDHLFTCMRDEIVSAMSTISMEVYALDNAYIVDALTETLEAGVRVSILLDGSSLGSQGKWACQQFEARGGECWLMAGKPQSNVHKRYYSQHGKWLIIDQARVLIGSENFGDDAMPADDKRDGTRGTRGGYMITDSPTLVAAAQTILDRDLDPGHHADVRRWGTNTDDFPPLGFVPNYTNGGRGYVPQFPTPLVLNGIFSVELVQCPDNCLRQSDALLGMIAQAGAGDTLLVEQLYEYTYWGTSKSSAAQDPNLRLEAYIAAAKRGARVRILLDSFFDAFDDPRSNYATCAYVNQFAPRNDIQCRLGNPTGRGIHMKMVLLKHAASGFVHLGSINGSETSSKLNRELATQVESLDAYNYWANVFAADWSTTTFAPHRQFLPLIERKRP